MICKRCGKEFTGRPGQLYCSQSCRYEGYKESRRKGFAIYMRKCPVCLEEFNTTNPEKVFCCGSCASEYRDIASHILRRRRPKIIALIKRARETDEPLAKLIKEIPYA